MGWLRPGRTVRVCRGERVYHHGVVEVVMPQAMVLWIREAGLGTRKMIDLEEFVLHPC
ncbi:hypothetical protein ACH9EU_00810 [Kocuria sp. M1R5S2]|uniref:hypothetical protein n=1 Tax=Kocuria rhizosphaerae TaxID=3376285 RepID=UPI0037A02532